MKARWIASFAVALVLAACAGNDGTPHDPTPPAPLEQFKQEAQQVVNAWHAVQSTPAWSTGFIPLGDVVQLGPGDPVGPGDPGFTNESRLSYFEHRFAMETELSGVTPAPARLSFPDGGVMTVDVQSPRETFGWLDRMAVGATSKPITVTAATLTTMRIRTTRGEVVAPAWSFATKELRVPIVRLAVESESITAPSLPRQSPLLGWDLVQQVDRLDDSRVIVSYLGGVCEANPRAHALETPTEVVIGVAVSDSCHGGARPAIGIPSVAELKLASPLANRAVLTIDRGLLPVGLCVS